MRTHSKSNTAAPLNGLVIGAIIGVSVYFLSDTTVGTFIVLGSMVFKIAETILRFIR